MDRRSFLRIGGLSLIAVPFGGLLAACALPAADQVASPGSGRTSRPGSSTTAPPPPPAGEPAPRLATTTTAAATLTVAAFCRDSWGARAAGSGLVPHTIERLTVHHTGVVLDDNRHAPGRLRRHQAYHQSLGWPDLAYHFAVDAAGNVYEGRTPSVRGDTATEYDPTGHFLVVAEGNFDVQSIPPAQLAAVADVLAWASVQFEVEPETIGGHRDYAATSCPGKRFQPLIADGTLEAMVRERRNAGGTALALMCGPQADAAVAAIESGEAPAAQTPAFYLRHSNAPGPADERIDFGEPGWVPVAGNFGSRP